MKSLMRNPDFCQALQSQLYAQPALIPAMPWLDRMAPPKPAVTLNEVESGSRLTVNWNCSETVAWWLVQSRVDGKWKTEVLPGSTNSRIMNSRPEVVAVTAVDRSGNVSPAATFQRRGS
jgi:hypothetical protein